MKGNENDKEQYCDFLFNPFTGKRFDTPVPVRKLKVDMLFDRSESKFRPLGFKKRGGNQSLENIADCDNTRYLFNYPEDGFDGVKKRTIIIIDE